MNGGAVCLTFLRTKAHVARVRFLYLGLASGFELLRIVN